MNRLPKIHKLLSSRAAWIVLLTVLLAASLVSRANPYPADQWSWHGRTPALTNFARWLPAIIALAVTAAVMAWLDRRYDREPPPRRAWPALLFLVAAIPVIQVCLVYVQNKVPLVHYFYRTVGPHNGFWQTAIGTDDLARYLREYPGQMLEQPFVHLMTHPPGNVVYVWLWRQAFRAMPGLGSQAAHLLRLYLCGDVWFVNLDDDQIATALAQMAVPLFSGLTVVPLYLLGKRLAGARAGLRAAALYAVVPALGLFTMRWDQIYPLHLCLALYCLHLGLERRGTPGGAGLFLLSGLTLSLSSFLSFGNVLFLAALGLYGLFHLVSTGPAGWRRWVGQTWPGWAALALGTASVWLVYGIVSGNSFWDVFSAGIAAHFNLGRTYWTWVLLNPYDFLTFLGIPVAVLFVAGGWRAWRQALASRGRDVPAGAVVALAVTGTLLLANLSGTVRGEVARLWLPWMAAACLVAATSLAGAEGRRLYRLALAVAAFQALAFTLFFRVAATGMPAYRPHEPNTTPPPVARPVDVRFGEEIALLGFDLGSEQVAPGETLHLTLYWQALDRPRRPYTVFTHLIDGAGALWGQQDRMPVRNTLPTTCWVPGEFVTDPYEIEVAGDTPAGEVWVEVGFYWLPTGERLPAGGEDAAYPDRILLGPVEVGKE